MDTQRELLQSLSRNQLDRIRLMSNLKKFKVNFDDDSSYVILKYKLKLNLIENIAKGVSDEFEAGDLARMKKETEDFLAFHTRDVSKDKFKCCLAGCLFQCKRHKYYVRHLQRVHPKNSNLMCKYGSACKRVFSTLALLKEHIKNSHLRKVTSSEVSTPSLLDVPCKCSIAKCHSAQFTSIKILMLHLRNFHVKNGEMVNCIFDGCASKYDKSETLRRHFQNKHIKSGSYCLKPHNKPHNDQSSRPTSDNQGGDDGIQVESMMVEEEVNDIPGFEEEQEFDEYLGELEDRVDEDLDEVFMMAYCDFLNQLTNFQFIPQSSIQLISEEYLKNYKKSNQVKTAVLRESLLKNIPEISEAEITKILSDVADKDAFLDAQLSLDSDYKRIKYLKDHFKYVEPKEIIFNPREVREHNSPKAILHYVPIIETVKT